MRILVLDQYGERGGAQNCLVEAVHGFRSRGWEVHALVPNGPLLDSLRPLCASARALEYRRLSSGRKTARDVLSFAAQFFPQSLAIAAMVNERQIDVLYVNGPRLMPPAALAHGAAMVVFHAHNVVTQSAAAKMLLGTIRLSGAHVIASSEFVAAALRYACGNHLSVVPNGVASKRVSARAPNAPFTVGMLSRIAPEKGPLTFGEAARIARRSMPGSRFVLGGDVLFGGDRTYADQVRSECKAAGVELAGWVDDTAAFLANLDVLVVPSSGEDATPRVVLEAFSAGIPVVAFDAGGLREIVRHGEDGVLVPAGNVTELAAQLQTLALAPERLAYLSRNAYRRWLTDFTVERFQEGVCDAVVEASARRRHHRSPLASAGASAEA